MTIPHEPDRPENSGYPADPVAPGQVRPGQVRPGPVPAPRPPLPVRLATWFWIVGAAVSIAGAVVNLGTRQRLTDSMTRILQNGPQPLPPEFGQRFTATMVDLTLYLGLAVAVIEGGLWVLFAVKMRAGRNWARITLTVFAGLALLSALFLLLTLSLPVPGASADPVFYLIAEPLTIAAAVLGFLPSSNAYFNTTSLARRMARYPYQYDN